MLAAWAIEALFSWPAWLFDRIRHPVVWIGSLIAVLDDRLNRPDLGHAAARLAGVLTLLLVVVLVAVIAVGVSHWLPATPAGFLLEAIIASSLLASRSLYAHVNAVSEALQGSGLASARDAVSRIVGRDPAQLDAPAISRASLESLAENASDGVVAPLFWGAVLGLPGIAAYKAINTLDSMIGHKTSRYRYFGWASARVDDLANLVPARLTALAFAIAGFRAHSFRVAWYDAGKHRSPNAGWPEAAMAGALGVRLSGPRRYDGETTTDPWLNADGPDPDARDVSGGLRLYLRAMSLVAVCLALVALAGFAG
ncbi:MAG: adenosylcobinamide-phosphate synthase CbiB [Pseudomonadota bacterium]